MKAGGTPRHNQIAGNTISELDFKLEDKDCVVYPGDMKIAVKSNGLFSYADASVVCGEAQSVPDRNDVLTNPVLIAEVLSPSTDKYDRSQKFELYRGLDSLQSYLLVDQSRVYVEHHQKVGPNKWEMEIFTGLDQTIEVRALAITLAVARLYKKVKFD